MRADPLRAEPAADLRRRGRLPEPPRQQRLVVVRGARKRQGDHQALQAAIRLHPVGLAGLQQGVQIRTRVGATDGVAE